MKYRVDEKSGNSLSILGFGCMRFPKKGNRIDFEGSEKLVLGAIKRGVNYFDTAYIYGASEETLGKILKKNGVREKVFIATKLPIIMCKSASDFDKYFNKELERLKTDYIDYYLMHMLTDMGTWKKLCKWGIREWLENKKKEGKIRHVGFSFHGIRDEFMSLIDAYDWEICLIQYNYSNENYQAGVTGLKRAHEKKIPVVIMEPLLGGRLATGLPLAAVRAFKKENPELSPAEWGLRWLWNQKEVTVVLSGMNSAKQVRENIAAADRADADMLTDSEIKTYARVNKIFNDSYKIHCTGCGYCMPCPKNVNIPSCFAAYNASFALHRSTGAHQYFMSSGVTSEKLSNAGQCVKCRKCEAHCPQGIKISEELVRVKKRMEPFWFSPGIAIARVFLGKSRKRT